MNATVTKQPTIVKKLSVKQLIGHAPDAPERGDDKPKWLADVIGRAVGIKQGESNYGPWFALTGEFIARQIPTGAKDEVVEHFKSGMVFVPDLVLNLIEPAMQATGGAIEFGFRLGIKRDDASATKYVYVAESLIEPAESDPLTKLANQVFGDTMPKLEDKSGNKK